MAAGLILVDEISSDFTFSGTWTGDGDSGFLGSSSKIHNAGETDSGSVSLVFNGADTYPFVI